MGIVDTITNILFGTERVKASKAECKEKKRVADEKYKEEMKRIEAECEASLTKAKEADKANVVVSSPYQPPKAVEPNNGFYSSEPPSPEQPERIGGKKGGKSKKRSKSNKKKTSRKH